MRRTILLAGFALVLGVLLSGTAFAGSGGTDRPFMSTLSGSGTLNLSSGVAHAVYSGQVTELGLTTVDETVQFYPTGPGTFGEYATATWTAANGDKLFLTGTGTSTTTDGIHFTITVQDSISGGTGRFADATGSSHGTVHSTVVSEVGGIEYFEVEGTGVGQLSY